MSTGWKAAPSRWIKNGALPRPPKGQRGESSPGWFAEGFTHNEYHCHRIKAVLQKGRTAFQDCLLTDTYSYGRCLILDGEMQSAQDDEFIYHEALVQPAMTLNAEPRNILILGGGEGATTREALRHPSVGRVVMADIDGEVLDFCQRYLPSWHQGSFDDPRVRLLVEDARLYVENTRLGFDVILSDLPSAIEGGPAYQLYTQEFYRTLKRRLNPGGVFALQAGSGQVLQINFHKALVSTLRRVFRVVRPYYVYIPIFDVPWAFCLCTDDERCDPLRLGAARLDARLRERGVRGLRFFDGTACEGLFRIPKYYRDMLSAERRVIRGDRPMFLFR